MTTTPGYDRPLYILPFDHRGTFLAKMLGAKGPPTAEQAAAIAAMKQVIYDGFRAALAGGVPRDKAGILVDEQFGADVLRDATARATRRPSPSRRAARTSSTSSTATTSPPTSRRSAPPSPRSWCATTPRATPP